jgi:hypothetical protein
VLAVARDVLLDGDCAVVVFVSRHLGVTFVALGSGYGIGLREPLLVDRIRHDLFAASSSHRANPRHGPLTFVPRPGRGGWDAD